MKKGLLALLIVTTLLSGGCKKFSFGKKQDAAYLQQVQAKMEADSIRYAEELQRAKDESQQTMDSLKSNCAKPAAGDKFSYYVITGAFQEANNASNYKEKMDKMGYSSEIIDGPFGFKLVSVSGTNEMNEAINVMNTMRNAVTEKAWVFIKK